MPKTKPVPADLIPIAAVLVLALAVWLLTLPGGVGGYVEIAVADQPALLYPLDRNDTVELNSRGVSLTVVIDNGTAYVAEADCRDGVCRSMGRISREGQSIVCAPAGVVVRIVGGEPYADGIAG